MSLSLIPFCDLLFAPTSFRVCLLVSPFLSAFLFLYVSFSLCSSLSYSLGFSLFLYLILWLSLPLSLWPTPSFSASSSFLPPSLIRSFSPILFSSPSCPGIPGKRVSSCYPGLKKLRRSCVAWVNDCGLGPWTLRGISFLACYSIPLNIWSHDSYALMSQQPGRTELIGPSEHSEHCPSSVSWRSWGPEKELSKSTQQMYLGVKIKVNIFEQQIKVPSHISFTQLPVNYPKVFLKTYYLQYIIPGPRTMGET